LGRDIAEYSVIYLRVVGKRLEDATVLVNYAKENGVKLVDRVYNKSFLIPSTVSKAMEMKKLINAGIPVPDTYFGKLFSIAERAEKYVGYPFVIKSTTGKKARDVWSPKTKKELEETINYLRKREIRGEKFFAQRLIQASQRIRVLVVGNEAIGAITRPTKWRKRWLKRVDGEYPEGIKESIHPVPKKYSELAIRAMNAADLEISGIDILEEDKTGKLYIIEANAAPSWNLIKKDTGINVEEKILKFLFSL
jgi:RimK family alpha-L-glutamate ligase